MTNPLTPAVLARLEADARKSLVLHLPQELALPLIAAAMRATWRDISDYDPAIHSCNVLITGRYPNGIPWVEEAYWDARGHFAGHKGEENLPSHWQPLPDPPASEPTPPPPIDPSKRART